MKYFVTGTVSYNTYATTEDAAEQAAHDMFIEIDTGDLTDVEMVLQDFDENSEGELIANVNVGGYVTERNPNTGDLEDVNVDLEETDVHLTEKEKRYLKEFMSNNTLKVKEFFVEKRTPGYPAPCYKYGILYATYENDKVRDFPLLTFEIGTMFKDMESCVSYSPEELGLC